MIDKRSRSRSISNSRNLSKGLFQSHDFSNTKKDRPHSGRLCLKDDLNSTKMSVISGKSCRLPRTQRASKKENMELDIVIPRGSRKADRTRCLSRSFSNSRNLSKALFQSGDFSNAKKDRPHSGRLCLKDDLNSTKMSSVISGKSCRLPRTRCASNKENMELDIVIPRGSKKPDRTRCRSRSFSNSRNLSKALFQSGDFSNAKKDRPHSGRLCLQDDLNSRKMSSVISGKSFCLPRTRRVSDKENMELDIVIPKGSRKPDKTRLEHLPAKDINAFRSSPLENQMNEVEDEVFFDENVCPESASTSSTTWLLSTPTKRSTRPPSSPNSVCSGSSKCHFSFGDESTNSPHIARNNCSPHIARSTCICTPVRKRLVEEGPGTEEAVLGQGAYGTVLLGRWLGRKVAVKVMEKERLKRSNRRKKSLEGELHARKMNHDNVLKVFNICSVEDMNAILIMEYVGSRNLNRLLSTPETHLSVGWLLQCGFQVASALEHCHARGVVHMDVKPANILITSSGLCKLGDFGCSVSLDNPDLEIDSTLVGTPGYQAPEFLRGSSPSPPCDVYSLGMLLWQLDSREIPFQGVHAQIVMFQVVSACARPSPPPKHLAFVDRKDFTALYQRCWIQGPSQRPTAADVAHQLNRMIEDSKVVERKVAAKPVDTHKSKHNARGGTLNKSRKPLRI